MIAVMKRMKRLASDRRGVSAVEFALIAPVLIVMYLGIAQTTLALSADRKATSAASIAADLVAQLETLSDSDLDDVFAAANAVMSPFDASALSLTITSVRMDENGAVFVDWSEARGRDPHPSGSAPALPEGLLTPSTSVVMVETAYAFSTPFKGVADLPLTMTETAYMRPRRAPHVLREGAPESSPSDPPPGDGAPQEPDPPSPGPPEDDDDSDPGGPPPHAGPPGQGGEPPPGLRGRGRG